MKITHYDIQSVRFIGPKIWHMVPNDVKSCGSLNNFKKYIKWKPNKCPCRLFKRYIAEVGFI